MKTIKHINLPFYTQGDLAALSGKSVEDAFGKPLDRDQLARLEQYSLAAGPAYTGWMDGKRVGCGGVHGAEDGSGVIWLVITREMTRQPRELLWALRTILDAILTEHQYTRMHAYVAQGFDAGIRLAEHVGFARTGKILENAIELEVIP